jgi:hypothetical protein
MKYFVRRFIVAALLFPVIAIIYAALFSVLALISPVDSGNPLPIIISNLPIIALVWFAGVTFAPQIGKFVDQL